jgi:hypothetical protein
MMVSKCHSDTRREVNDQDSVEARARAGGRCVASEPLSEGTNVVSRSDTGKGRKFTKIVQFGDQDIEVQSI